MHLHDILPAIQFLPYCHLTMSLLIDACIAQHQGDRLEQQDRVALMPHPKGGGVALAVVADSMSMIVFEIACQVRGVPSS